MGEGTPDIEILIGADVAGKLLTGNVHQLKCGLTAVETQLGWTLMGKVPGSETYQNNCLLVHTLLTSQAIPDLWKLETLGIMDSGESKSRAAIELATKTHFLETVKVLDNLQLLAIVKRIKPN